MPTKRTRRARHRRFSELPDYVLWWLKNGRSLNRDECRAAGFDDPEAAAWGLLGLRYNMEPVASAPPHVWSRQRLREAGYGAEVDAVEEQERAEQAEQLA